MDFIEKLLGISPDGGSGATEAWFLLIPAFVAALVGLRRYRRKA